MKWIRTDYNTWVDLTKAESVEVTDNGKRVSVYFQQHGKHAAGEFVLPLRTEMHGKRLSHGLARRAEGSGCLALFVRIQRYFTYK